MKLELYRSGAKARASDVAQTGSLPYRGLAIRRRRSSRTLRRLTVGDTAGYQPALREILL
jgi:hypothetical protein